MPKDKKYNRDNTTTQFYFFTLKQNKWTKIKLKTSLPKQFNRK